MTLPASGPISLWQIADEFGIPRTTLFPSGFYGRGGAPSSGPLSFADFYGRSAATVITAHAPGYADRTVTNGMDIAVEETSVTLNASATTTFNYTRQTSFGNPTTGSSTGTSLTFNLPSSTATRTASWTVTVAGMTFTIHITRTGTA